MIKKVKAYGSKVMAKDFSVHQLVDAVRAMVERKRCLWSQQQTVLSLAEGIQQEVEELKEAILMGKSSKEVASEMGDVLVLVMMACFVGERDGVFSLDDPVQEEIAKLKRRAPFIFDDSEMPSSFEEAEKLWQEVKKKEKEQEAASS